MPTPESKQNFALLRDKILSTDGKEYWRSVEEYVDAPEFKEFVSREYPHEIESWDSTLSRRNFVKVMGASLALAGLTGCVIQPPEKIVPYVRNPEGMLPGRPNFYATAMTLGGVATGLLAKAYEGRPVKIEGNPDHPGSRGSTDVLAQASILNMYDPDRSQEVTFRGDTSSWERFVPAFRSALDENRADGGAGVRFLTETITSPTLIDQFNKIKTELPNAKWVQYEPLNADNATAGANMALGTPVQTIYHLEKAARILLLDADIFSGFNVALIKDYAAGRKYSEEKKDINRLYMVETTTTITGAKADHRLAVKPSELAGVARAIAAAVGVAGANSVYSANAAWITTMAKDLVANKGKSVVVAGDTAPPIVHALAHAMNGALGNVGQTVSYADSFSPNANRTQLDQLKELVGDIDAGRVKMLVILGGNPVYNTPADLRLNAERLNKVPLRVHLGQFVDETAELCHWHINEKHFLEGWSDTRAYDGTVTITQPLIEPLYGGKNVHEVVQLVFKENFDKKDYDIVREYWQRTNITAAPAAAAPPKSATSESTANTNSETAAAKPETNAQANTAAAPATAPKTAPASMTANTAATATSNGTSSNGNGNRPAANGAVAGAAAAGAAKFDENWRKVVHDGVVPNTAAQTKTVAVNGGFLAQPEQKPAGSGDLEISIRRDPNVYDGRFVNNGWLQELPKPLNKVTWENIAYISPRDATRLGINRANDPNEFAGGAQGESFINTKGGNQFADLVTLTYQDGKISKPVPMWIQPGQPDGVITIFMGYGRERAGRVGNGLGYNAFDVRRSDAMDFGFGGIQRTGETTDIASSQIHFNMEGRDLLRTWDVDKIDESIKAGEQHNEYPKSMYPYEQHQQTYEHNHRWGMTVDLNNCIGCNACVIACQSENNIPVVGKEQVNRSREMQWLRIDAYYSGTLEDAEGPDFQPLLCQQCEQAPCEVVCPVHATVHSAEGLNDMVYNRCVGTRYCSNNCPYKVRRFNFLLYQDWNTPQYKLMRNPEVSIRSRGVMEKCTFCTQRISAVRIEAEKDGRKIRDGEVMTACQAACPTDVFTFGDLNDPESAVAKSKKDERNYILLNELNTQPRLTYMAGLKNQNPEMPDYKPRVQKGHGDAEEPHPGDNKTGGVEH